MRTKMRHGHKYEWYSYQRVRARNTCLESDIQVVLIQFQGDVWFGLRGQYHTNCCVFLRTKQIAGTRKEQGGVQNYLPMGMPYLPPCPFLVKAV